VSWPREVGQVPVFFAQRPSGRPDGVPGAGPYTCRYLDVPNAPLFAFGHGLSFGHCALSDLKVTPAQLPPTGTLEIEVTVTNEGPGAAQETVFVFTHDVVAAVARPVLELRAVGRIALAPGESGRLHLTFPATDLSFLGPDLAPLLEPGDIEVYVGASAERSRLLTQTVRLLPPSSPGRR
jgi:beta-glucosidase